MATELKSLKIDRVDLVPEGANSAAFVTLYKGKEMNTMELEDILAKLKPEHAEVINARCEKLTKEAADAKEEADNAKNEAEDAKAEAAKAKEEAEEAKAEAEAAKANSEDEDDMTKKKEGNTSFDESEILAKSLKSADPLIREYVERISKQKEAAELVAKEAIAKEKHAEAEAKAEELKALPIEKSKLVEFIEKSSDDTVEMLTAVAKGIEATVLTEVGKAATGAAFSSSSSDAWSKIEKSAEGIAKERGISHEAAVSVVLDEQPELYREYLKGGAN